jgi:hypothetical protein
VAARGSEAITMQLICPHSCRGISRIYLFLFKFTAERFMFEVPPKILTICTTVQETYMYFNKNKTFSQNKNPSK